MNHEKYRFKVTAGKSRTVQFHNKNKQNWEDCRVDWAGNSNRQVHNTALLQDFNVHESSKLQVTT